MRLSSEQVRAIVDVTQAIAGARTQVWLFGSRLDDQRKGGDVDLLIEPAEPVTFLQRARLKMSLEQLLNLPVDLLLQISTRADSAFVAIARKHALLLNDLGTGED